MGTSNQPSLSATLRPAADYLVEHQPFYASLIRSVQFRSAPVVAGLSVLPSDVVLVNPALFGRLEKVEYQAHALAQHAMILAMGPFWQGALDHPAVMHGAFGSMSLALLSAEGSRWVMPRLTDRVDPFFLRCGYAGAAERIRSRPEVQATMAARPFVPPTAVELDEYRQRAFTWVARLVQAGQEARLLGRPSAAYACLTEQAMLLRSPWHGYLRSMLGRLDDRELTPTARGVSKRRRDLVLPA